MALNQMAEPSFAPNPRLQRTRAAPLLQSVGGEHASLGALGRAPLSRKPLGDSAVEAQATKRDRRESTRSTPLCLMAAAALVLAIGCGSVGVTRVKPAPSRPATCALEIFTSEQEVKRPFEVLCLIDSRTGTTAFDDKTAAAAINRAKPEACSCGADAILITGVDTQGPGWGTWGQGKAIIKAIRFTDK